MIFKARITGILTFGLLLFSACSKNKSDADAGSATEPMYAISDSTPYQTPDGNGISTVLTRDDVVIDTIDAAFGVHSVGRDSVLFQPLESNEPVLYHAGYPTTTRATRRRP
jgi:hypothetical protein